MYENTVTVDFLSYIYELLYNSSCQLSETMLFIHVDIFGHLQPKKRNLAGQSRRTKWSIQLTQQKNLVSTKIKSASLPEQQVTLTQLLINIKCKIQSLRKTEKAREWRWLTKKARNKFNVNPHKAGKNLPYPKCYCSLNVDQETLDQHKSSNLFDKNL